MIRMHRMAETLDSYIILVIDDSILVILSTERVLVAVSAAL